MSYALSLRDPVTGDVLELDVPLHMRIGIFAGCGTIEASLNVTYNYGGHFSRVFGKGGIRTLYGKTGAESLPLLTQAINKLGDDVSWDYWLPTEGNVKKALVQLRAMARLRPDGIWQGD